jgi:CobQ-like glutamine amidotransferase family enzyme
VRAINLGVIYPDDFNLNADAANLQVIRRRLELSGYQVSLHQIDARFQVPAGSLDFVVIGSPSSSVLEEALVDSKKFKQFATELVQENSVVLAISNGLHAFGSIVNKNGKPTPSLEIFDFVTTFGSKQHVTIAAEVTTEFGSLVGVENHNSKLVLGPNEKPLGKISYGTGNDFAGLEGFLAGNFFGSHFHGPLLALNESFADEIVSRIVSRAGGKFEPSEALSRLNDLSKQARNHLLRRRA